MTEQKKRFDSKGKGATQRNKGKFRKPAPPKTAETYTPVNLYISACCNVPGKKAPLVKQDRGSKTFGEGHLGVFRCSGCNKHSTFSAQKNKDQVVFAL